MQFTEVVSYLESLQIMPKTMPGLQKMQAAFADTSWFSDIDPGRVIVVAGTNGKGTTCAALESLLVAANQNVGFYSSPHLVSTVERIRINTKNISEEKFVELFLRCRGLIEKHCLTHFESLTLMAAEYFFGPNRQFELDFAIFEVGLGGEFDATNAVPHKYCIITKIGIDHTNILGNSIEQIARAKFGIVGKKNIVVHHRMPEALQPIQEEVRKRTNSNWIETHQAEMVVSPGSPPRYSLRIHDLNFAVNVLGKRGGENLSSAITMFHVLGFDLRNSVSALNYIKWSGRMQKISYDRMPCDMYVSGDHNEQGIDSLIDILNDFRVNRMHIVVGIGVDKDAEAMLEKLFKLPNVKIYLTQTPFKGRTIGDYPEKFLKEAAASHQSCMEILKVVSQHAVEGDLCVVTGSLYLAGEIIKELGSTHS